MEDNSGNTFTSDRRTRAALDQVSDRLPNEIPVVREQLWRPVRVPDETCWERQPAPMSNWTQVLTMARPYTRIFVMASIYLAVVAAVSLIVARAISTPAKSTSAAETGHQQSRNGLVPYRLTPSRPSAPRKSPAIRQGADLPAAARTGSVHALTGIKPAWFRPSFTFTSPTPTASRRRPHARRPARRRPAHRRPAHRRPPHRRPPHRRPPRRRPPRRQPPRRQPPRRRPARRRPARRQPPRQVADSDANVSVLSTRPRAHRAVTARTCEATPSIARYAFR